MKKILAITFSLLLVFSLTACGGGGDAKDCVTPEQYKALCDEKWGSMDKAAMEEFLGVKSTVDEESTASWGEGYESVVFPGPDENSNLYVLFQQDDDGTWSAASMSPTGALMD